MSIFSDSGSGFSVKDSDELRRIIRLPKRKWTTEQANDLADRLTEALKTPNGTMRLKPIQAVALYEAAKLGGALLPFKVGGGKTLASLLMGRIFVDKHKPLLLIPAHLIEKTRREMDTLRKHWYLPERLRIESYQKLSRVSAATLLEEYRPDLIIADEAHYLKNPQAACTKRLARYIKPRYGKIAFVAMSGTFFNRSIREAAHLASWCLTKTNPFPEDWQVLNEWSCAIDVNVANHRRMAPGALSALRSTPTEGIREAFRRRVVSSPGVVATQDPPLPIGLEVRSHIAELDIVLTEAYRRLREEWVTPDDWPIEDGVQMWRHARELSNGFYSVWDPRPPDEWRDARTQWARAVREILQSNRRNLDTELQVRMAVAKGLYPLATKYLRDWDNVKDTFTPNAKAVWVSDKTIKWIKAWAKKHGPALIWTDRPALGEAIGLPYYGQQGLTEDGKFIEDHDPLTQGSAVLSIDANKEGRNLQHRWSRNLILDVPPNGKRWEQMLGRTHRDGQPKPVVTVDVLFGCLEDVAGFWRAVEDSNFAEELTGQAQKLSHADLDNVLDLEEAMGHTGYQWQKPLT